jgi:restriction endonuclease S subunit
LRYFTSQDAINESTTTRKDIINLLSFSKRLNIISDNDKDAVQEARNKNQIHVLSAGAAYKALTIVKLKQLQIPVPPQEIQNQIVAKIGNEKDLVNSSKQIIEIFDLLGAVS